MLQNKMYIFLLFSLFIGCCTQTQPKLDADSAVPNSQQDPCDNPDAAISCCFENMPSQLNSIMQLAEEGVSGERIIISGKILRADSMTPLPHVILYAYQTDNDGYYSKKGNETGVQKWHGYLHGWCKTDLSGYYEIRTIRPAPYPDNSMPAHIHPVLMLNSQEIFYINDFVFFDDPKVDQKYLSSLTYPGGNGIVKLIKDNDKWTGTRNIILDY